MFHQWDIVQNIPLCGMPSGVDLVWGFRRRGRKGVPFARRWITAERHGVAFLGRLFLLVESLGVFAIHCELLCVRCRLLRICLFRSFSLCSFTAISLRWQNTAYQHCRPNDNAEHTNFELTGSVTRHAFHVFQLIGNTPFLPFKNKS